MGKSIVIIANHSGGLYSFRKMLIEQLVKSGHSLTILTPFTESVEELKALGVALIDTPINRRGINPVEDYKLYRLYKKLLKQLSPDLVITYTIKPNIYGGMACRQKKIPYAVNITGLGTAFQGNGVLKRLVVTLYKASLKRAKVVFFENCENQKIFIDNKIIKESKTCLLNGAGVDLAHFTPIKYPSDDTVNFLFIGRIMKEKGVDELFEAMKKLYAEGIKCKLRVVGGCEEDYNDILKQYEKEGWLVYHGYQKDVRPFIAESHCFILPSWHEGMANTNLESAASARPIITTNIHGCLEAVEDGVSGFLVPKKNSDALYETMKSFAALPFSEKEKMGLAGRTRMEELFDKKKVVKNTLDALDI